MDQQRYSVAREAVHRSKSHTRRSRAISDIRLYSDIHNRYSGVDELEGPLVGGSSAMQCFDLGVFTVALHAILLRDKTDYLSV